MIKKLRLTYAAIFCSLLFTEIYIGLFVHDSFIRPYIGDVLVTVLVCSFFRVFIPKGVTALPVYVLLFASSVLLSPLARCKLHFIKEKFS